MFREDGVGDHVVMLKGGNVKLLSIPTTDAGDYDLRYDATDGIVYDTSDERQKKDQISLGCGLAEIWQLQPRK